MSPLPDDRVTRMQNRADAENRRRGPKTAITMRTILECARQTVTGQWLHRPYLERNATAVLFGDFGTLKSFVALDWAMRVALGQRTLGHQYQRAPAPVVFISAEGRGLPQRVRAWCRHHAPGKDMETLLSGVPLHTIEHPVNLSDGDACASLVAAVEALGITPAMVVVDTLSRNSGGDVEASTADAAAYLVNVDRSLRARFGCAVLLVHHVGHVAKDRVRGPIVLAANTDALIRVERVPGELVVNVTVERLKDCAVPPPMSLRGVVVDLGEQDEDGEPVTSLALEANGEVVPLKKPPTGKNQAAILAGLREWQRAHPDAEYITSTDAAEVARAQGVKDRRRRAEVLDSLVNAGHLAPAVGGYRLEC